MKSALRKLIPSLVMVLITAAMVGTSTFAWFSMNNKVTVTGMTVTTKVGNSLQVAADSLSSTAKVDEANFNNGIDQETKGFLAPVSTIDGVNFFYNSTSNTKANGDAIADTYLSYSDDGVAAASTETYGNAFSENYDIKKTEVNTATGVSGPALGYVDYVFQLKATNTQGSSVALKMTKCNLLYNSAAAAANEIKAYRVAVFVEDITTAASTGSVGTLKTILRQTGAAYFTSTNAIKAKTGETHGAVPDIDTAATLDTFTENGTKYYKVVVRMWLEGEDTTCKNETYLALNGKWSLDLAIELGGENAAVTNIGTVANVTANGNDTPNATLTLDSYLNAATTVKTYQWYNAADDSPISGATNATFTNSEAAKDVYCIVTAYGSKYKSNTVHLTV